MPNITFITLRRSTSINSAQAIQQVDLVKATSELNFLEYSQTHMKFKQKQHENQRFKADKGGWFEMIKRKRALKRLIVTFFDRMIEDGDVEVVKYIFAHMGDTLLTLLDELHHKKYSNINNIRNDDNDIQDNVVMINDMLGNGNNDNIMAMRVIDTRNYRSVLNFSKNGNMIFHCNQH